MVLGYCVDDTCSLDCGHGFVCVRVGGSEHCENDADLPGFARILSIEPEHSTGAVPVHFTCEAKGPQLVDVRFHITSPEGESTAFPGVLSGGDQFSTTWKPSVGTEEGRWTAHCDLVFGPPGAELITTSTPRAFHIDHTAPSVQHDDPEGWHSTHHPIVVRAVVVDPTPAGSTDGASGLARVWLETEHGAAVDGVEDGDDEWVFHLAPSPDDDPASRGSLGYSIFAMDRAGNVRGRPGSLRVDNRAPTITVVDEVSTHWRSPSASIDIVALVETAPVGAPLASESVALEVSGASESSSVPGTLVEPEEGLWTFRLDPDLLKASLSGTTATMVELDWTIRATTTAGVVGSEVGVLRFDSEGPDITINAPEWVKWGEQGAIEGSVEDPGCGVDHEGFGAESNAGEIDCQYAGGTFSCVFSTDRVPVEEVAFVGLSFSARDTCGNESTVSLSVGVDGAGPVVNVPADESWNALLHPLSILIEIADDCSGLAAEPPVLETIPAPGVAFASTSGVRATDGWWAFVLNPRRFLDAGQMYPELRLRLRALDAVGNATTEEFIRRVDGQGPSFTVSDVDGQPISRNADPITIEFMVDDDGRDSTDSLIAGAGVDPGSVVVVYSDLSGTAVQLPAETMDGRFSVQLDPSHPLFESANGPMELELRAQDLLGNESSHPFTIDVTRVLWEYDSKSSTAIVASPALADGVLIFAVSANGLNSVTDNLFAIDASTGTRLWSVRIPGTPTTPVALGNDAAYLAFVDGLGLGHVAAYPLHPEGDSIDPLWVCEDVGAVEGALGIAWWMWGGELRETVVAASSQKRILTILANEDACSVYASSTFAEDPASSTISVSGQRVWFAGTDGATGLVDFVTHPIASDIELLTESEGAPSIAGVSLDSARRAFSIHPGTLRRWTEGGLDYEAIYSGDVSTSVAPPSIGPDGAVWFGTGQGRVYRFDPPSTVVTQGFPVAPVDSDPIRGAPTIDSVGNAYFVTRSGVVRAHGPEGELLWSIGTGSGNVTSSSPVLGCDGTLYVATSNGRIVALAADGGPLADAPWPRFQHDNRNTGNADTPLRTGGECID